LLTILGPDYARYSLNNQEPVDEIEDYWKAHYLTAEEAAWRILGYHISHKEPAVSSLTVHLPTDTTHHQQYQNKSQKGSFSSLMHYFHRPQGNFVDSQNNTHSFDSLTYAEYFQMFRLAPYNSVHNTKQNYYCETPNIINAPQQHVILRTTGHVHVARLQPILPSKGELFYLRILLRSKSGRSFDDYYTVNGVHYSSFQESAIAEGFFANDNEAEFAISEAINSLQTPHQLQILFVHLLTNDCVPNPTRIWETFGKHFATDFTIHHHNNIDMGKNQALIVMAHSLEEYGKTLSNYSLPEPEAHSSELEHELNRWETHIDTISNRATSSIATLTTEQQAVLNQILHPLKENQQILAYIDG
jgi:hypothetical protein